MFPAPASARHEPADESASAWVRRRAAGSSAPGSILLHAPSFAFQAPGGGENQLVQTGRALERIGRPVRLFSPWVDRLKDCRLLHLFGMSREGLELARIAKSNGVPVALSTICWFDPAALRRLAPNPFRGGLDAVKWSLKRLVPDLPTWRGSLLALADAVLPNSLAEADQLVALFGVSRERIHVVPNGVEERFGLATPDAFRERHGETPFALYVGRIEPRKNVKALIHAARLAGLPLTIMGEAPSGGEAYLGECRRAAGPSARFLGGVPHDDPTLASAYSACRVFALPSWFETPGLAAIEAASAGAAVVITPVGCTREYFSDDAIYARPDDPQAIARALTRAWNEGAPPDLAPRIRRRYPWSVVAERTAEAYDHILK